MKTNRRYYISSADIPPAIPFPLFPRRRGPGKKHRAATWERKREWEM